MKKLAMVLLLCCALLLTAVSAALADELVLPAGLREIEAEAFQGDNSITKVTLPDGLQTIGDRAFSGCTSLNAIKIPTSVSSINENAFEGCSSLTAYVYASSYALEYCIGHDIPYQIIVESAAGFTVTELDISNGTVFVTASASEACFAYVEVCDENEHVITTGEANVEEGADNEVLSVSLKNSYSFNGSFILRGYLLDGNGTRLSEVYTNIRHTTAYQTFESQTYADHDAAYSINYGSEGYVVVNENAKIIENPAAVNGLTYTFNSNQSIKAGDILLLTNSSGDKKPIKAESVQKNTDGSYTVTADTDVYLADLYDTVNISFGNSTTTRSRGASASEPESFVKPISHTTNISGLKVEITGSIKLHGEIKYDKKLLNDDYSIAIYADLDLNVKASCDKSVTNMNAFGSPLYPPLTVLETPIILIGTPAFAYIQASITVPLTYKIGGEGSVTLSYKKTFGVEYSNQNGTVNKTTPGEHESAFDFSAGFEISFGPEIAVELKPVVGNFLAAKLSASAMFKASGQDKLKIESTQTEKKHGCYTCIDADMNVILSASLEANWKINKQLYGQLFKFTFFEKTIPLGSFYISVANDKDSPFGGKLHTGWGECPNYSYLVTVSTSNKDGTPIYQIPVSIRNSNGDQLDGESDFSCYLYNGHYIATAEFDSVVFEKSFAVDDSVRTLNFVNDTFSILFVLHNGTVSAKVKNGEAIGKLPTATREGYTLAGWNTEADGTGQTVTGQTVPTSNMTVYAIWNGSSYTVAFKGNGGTVSESSVKVKSGDPIGTLPTATREDYTFVGWNTQVDGKGDAVTGGTVPTADMTVYAIWNGSAYTVSFNGNGGTVSESSVKVKSGDPIGTMPTATREGYVCIGWNTQADGKGQTVTGGTLPEADMTVNATWAEPTSDDQFKFTYLSESDSYKIYFLGSATDVVIPSSYQGKPVTSIGDDAFSHCTYFLKSVTIPDGVTSIGRSAFYDCRGLTSVTIPDSVTSIGVGAFYQCYRLTSVTIPNSVTSIGKSTFYKCTSLTSVTIPNSVTSIGVGAFGDCTSLTSVTIPNSVTSIGDSAFCNCSSLTSVTIPNSVTSIGNGAFDGCFSLTSVTIPNSVTSIGMLAFYDCSSLTSVSIPNSVTSIGVDTFALCFSLTSVTIPNSITSIGHGAFNYCSSLQSVTIPNSVIIIEDYTFQRCSSLQSVSIPNSVTSIGDSAFERCSSLTSVTIPNSVTSIGYGAFYGCSSLTLVKMPNPNSITMGNDVFTDCNSAIQFIYW